MQTGKYSFHLLGIYHGLEVMYTCTARADNFVTEEDFDGLIQLIDAHKTKRWLWIMDFQEMSYAKMMSLSFISRLVTYLKTEHTNSLTHIWIVNMNYWIYTILSYFVTAKVRMISEERRQIDMAEAMTELGFPVNQQTKLLTFLSANRTFGTE